MTYDFTFVLPGFNLTPPGGYMVVFELSKLLSERGYTVLIIFLKRMNKNLYNIEKNRKILGKILNTPFKFRIYDYVQNTTLSRFLINIVKKYPSCLKIMTIKLTSDSNSHETGTFFSEFNFDNLDFLVRKGIPDRLQTRRIFATAWETSYFVDRFQGCKLKYYLIQNDEDNPSFSGQLKDLARKSYDLDLKKIVINGHLQERFSAENPIKITVAAHVDGKVLHKPDERNNKVILMQIRDGYDKGAEYAIEAARLIKANRPDIDILSFGNYKQNLPSFITHLGYVSDARYIELFNLASIFVLPSIVEGFATPVLEAMSCGCVPVATKCGGPENFVQHNINGMLVSTKSPHDIADTVIWLLENENLRIEMAYNAIETSKNFSKERMLEKFLFGILDREGNTGISDMIARIPSTMDR
jgi:glycosyltransferase involved in cell wall biosynthesis